MNGQCYIPMYGKGDTFEGRVIRVSNAPGTYQEKQLWAVVLRDPANPDNSEDIKREDFQAQELTPAGIPSQMAKRVGEVVKFVILNKGGGDRLPWIKMDEPMIKAEGDDRDKMFLARDAFRMAVDLCVPQPTKFPFDKLDELAFKIAQKVIVLKNQL